MLRQVLFATLLITFATAQETKRQDDGLKQNQEGKPPLLYLGTPNSEFPQQNEIQPQVDLKQLYPIHPYSSQQYNRLQYLEPQYQAEGAIPGLQPQIVLCGTGGQGQPILINPGNPPGNFLIPQAPGPNIIVRNNPQGPQNHQVPVFPVAGYPKPAHIPPIEKDAEEIPINPANVPPLPSEVTPTTKQARNKPEKLETFNEPNQPDQNFNVNNRGHFPQINPETVNLQPGQRFFILNGDQIFSYPVSPQYQHNLLDFRYINAQPFPENPPKFLQTFVPQEQSQVAQENNAPAAVPNLIERNSFIPNSQVESKPHQSESQPKQPVSQPPQFSQADIDGTVKTAQHYFHNEFPVNLPEFYLNPQGYAVGQQASSPSIQKMREFEGVQDITSKAEVFQPQAVGQFRFTPSEVPGQFSYKDDFENDAVVVDASFDVPTNFDERRGSLKTKESTTLKPQQPIEKESEPSMAQAGPQATAIAGPGGVAGSAPRGTAIVGKGGLAVSSPQATAVAGTKDEEKRKKLVKKNT